MNGIATASPINRLLFQITVLEQLSMRAGRFQRPCHRALQSIRWRRLAVCPDASQATLFIFVASKRNVKLMHLLYRGTQMWIAWRVTACQREITTHNRYGLTSARRITCGL